MAGNHMGMHFPRAAGLAPADDWAERAARRADGSLDNADARALAVSVRNGLMEIANAFAARLGEIGRDGSLDEGERQRAARMQAQMLSQAVRKLDMLISQIAQRRERLQHDLAPHLSVGRVDPAMWPAMAALWPLLPDDNPSLVACYHDALRHADRLTVLAIETLPRTLYAQALTSEQLASASDARLAVFAEHPDIGAAVLELRDLREALGEISTMREALGDELAAFGDSSASAMPAAGHSSFQK